MSHRVVDKALPYGVRLWLDTLTDFVIIYGMSNTGSKCDDCGKTVYENEDHHCDYVAETIDYSEDDFSAKMRRMFRHSD